MSTGVRPGKGDPRALGLKRPVDGAATSDGGESGGPAGAPALGAGGVIRPVVAMLRFPGGHPEAPSAGSMPGSRIADLFFADRLDPARTGLPAQWRTSLRDYWAEASDGQLLVEGSATDVNGWLTVPQTLSWYADGEQGLGAFPRNAQGLAADAVAALDSSVDFRRYDGDGDGEVDLLVLVAEGWMNGSRDQLWPHYWTLSDVEADGVAIRRYIIVPEQFHIEDEDYEPFGITRGGPHPIGVLAHELGHALGLPDLYDTTYATTGIGVWGIMGHGAWAAPHRPALPGAWDRVRMGWAAPRDVTGAADARLDPASEGGGILRLWVDPYRAFEYYLVENRQKTGADAFLPGEGMLVWHVDERRTDRYPVDNDVNVGRYKGVRVVQADGLDELDGSSRGDAGDPFPGASGNHALSPYTSPATDANDGTSTGIRLDGIRLEGEVATARIEAPEPLGELLAHDEATAARGTCVLVGGSCAIESRVAVRFDAPRSGRAHALWFWTRMLSGERVTVALHADGEVPGELLWSDTVRVDGEGWTEAVVDAEVGIAGGDAVWAVLQGPDSPIFLEPRGPAHGRTLLASRGGGWTDADRDANLRLALETCVDCSTSVGPGGSGGGCSSVGGPAVGSGLVAALALAVRRRRRSSGQGELAQRPGDRLLG